jgi:hypothetical protein
VQFALGDTVFGMAMAASQGQHDGLLPVDFRFQGRMTATAFGFLAEFFGRYAIIGSAFRAGDEGGMGHGISSISRNL